MTTTEQAHPIYCPVCGALILVPTVTLNKACYCSPECQLTAEEGERED